MLQHLSPLFVFRLESPSYWTPGIAVASTFRSAGMNAGGYEEETMRVVAKVGCGGPNLENKTEHSA
jgi:hypothetical protein